MKLLFDCIHCQKENEILIQSMCITPKKVDHKKYQVAFYDSENKMWSVSSNTYSSINDFYENGKFSRSIDLNPLLLRLDNET